MERRGSRRLRRSFRPSITSCPPQKPPTFKRRAVPASIRDEDSPTPARRFEAVVDQELASKTRREKRAPFTLSKSFPRFAIPTISTCPQSPPKVKSSGGRFSITSKILCRLLLVRGTFRSIFRWVLPHWGKLELRAIKTVAVEQWLKTLVTSKFAKPKPLAGGTKEKIRDAMSSVFNHAIRWEFTERNPITGPTKRSGVRVSTKRQRTPDILEVEEMQLLFAALGVRERAMVFLDMPAGLRRGELA